MKKLKSSQHRDRLSELPDSLIFHIFWILPMRDVVRTTILSKHWKNLWTTAPCLNFDYDRTCDNPDIFRDFVNQALMSWEGNMIQKFRIDFYSKPDKSGFRDLDFWVYFAMRKKLQELYLSNYVAYYSLPQNLYTCSSLKVLSLLCCRLEINGNVQWNQLQRLTIDGAYMSEHAINQILCGSPQLKVFILGLLDKSENLNIRSSSLKRLLINHTAIRELRIWTPNLETLELYGHPYSKCLLMDVSSVTHITLGLSIHRHGRGFVGETLRQIFPSIQHVENVTLSDCCIKVLGVLKKKSLLPSSSNAKFLEFVCYVLMGCKEIVGFLETFPKLEMLALYGSVDQHYDESFDAEVDANVPDSFLLHLRTVEIIWRRDAALIFPFIKIVLKYATNLQKMVIRVAPQPSDSLFSASQILLRMPRSSPTAELIICEDLSKPCFQLFHYLLFHPYRFGCRISF